MSLSGTCQRMMKDILSVLSDEIVPKTEKTVPRDVWHSTTSTNIFLITLRVFCVRSWQRVVCNVFSLLVNLSNAATRTKERRIPWFDFDRGDETWMCYYTPRVWKTVVREFQNHSFSSPPDHGHSFSGPKGSRWNSWRPVILSTKLEEFLGGRHFSDDEETIETVEK